MTHDPSIAVRRSITIDAKPETVFSFFTESQRLSAWFGANSTIEPHPGGRLHVEFPGGGAIAEGQVVELNPPHRIVFTWGYAGSADLPPGASRVEVDLVPDERGTVLTLNHIVDSDRLAEAHIDGWRHHLSHLATVSSRVGHADVSTLVDQWHALWTAEEDRGSRLASIAADDVTFVDDLATVIGLDEVVAHIGNASRHLDGALPVRNGPARLVGDHVFADWSLRSIDGASFVEGRLVATIDLDSRITGVVSSWMESPEIVARRLAGDETTESLGETDDEGPIEPHLWAADLEGAVRWYRDVLGFVERATNASHGTPTWYQLARNDARLMIAQIPDDEQASAGQSYLRAVRDRMDHGGPISLYLRAFDVDRDWDRANTADANVLEDIWDPWWGGRQFTVEAPDGVWWTIHA